MQFGHVVGQYSSLGDPIIAAAKLMEKRNQRISRHAWSQLLQL